ncbi:glycosyltransferase family 4 protein [Algisphaera agarilytica]|uniref:UDP-glucose:(Heptosyl)LPS alpha-1,3-glucosyltransferase n=1 Tax=Algisphaera agarilytica TaxID=1385975 RepID=A0A7X0LKY5_9BACT|nr:glycosyltransferase family 4 protein [Algisphaera agarilytica]MBB6430935.1 UDP-glucose:(heptosyl)LPS alpha-1,3-glucosyltransferase [Algisphaera agarilytica]
MTEALRLAVVIESFNPAAGGNERSTQQIMQELVKRGHSVTLITGCCSTDNEPEGVETVALSQKKSSSVIRLMRFSRWAKRQLREGRFDASLSVTMAVPASVVQPRGGTIRETLARNVAMRGGGFRRTKKKIELALDPKQRLLLALEKKTLADHSVYRIAALSRYVVEQLETHFAFPESRTVVIPNAAVMPDLDADQRAESRRSIRHSFKVPDDAVLYLFAAQNPNLKGYPTLLGALKRLRDQGLNVVALLAGGFDYPENQAAEAQGVRDAVRIVGPTREMPKLFAAADVTVLPSWYDPSSKVVLESLMMETPAISTTYNGASDHLAPDGSPPRGCVIDDPGDPDKLADAMARLADSDFRTACSAACEGLADQLSMAQHVDQLEEVLAEAALAARDF